MRVAIGCDENACEMKEAIKAHLTELGVEYDDMGCDQGEKVLYPEIARRVAVSIMEGK
ncbi:MAG TPA: ribose-5-phosphate isomerase, partial [Firmicutes bacterium]|nr:ribose-5-phosphate isomerase [Bacillota bacterium]